MTHAFDSGSARSKSRSARPSPNRPALAPGHGTYVALLRGINLAGKNKLPMAGLVELFEAAGCAEVRTYIQSGNVVFAATPAVARRVPKAVADAMEQRFELQVPVVLRTAAELTRVAASNPYLKAAGAAGGAGVQESSLHVVFLADEPAASRVAALDPQRSPGDAFQVVGREVYVWLPNGAARTKLTNGYFDTKLATISTMRNWRTVQTLAELARGVAMTSAQSPRPKLHSVRGDAYRDRRSHRRWVPLERPLVPVRIGRRRGTRGIEAGSSGSAAWAPSTSIPCAGKKWSGASPGCWRPCCWGRGGGSRAAQIEFNLQGRLSAASTRRSRQSQCVIRAGRPA